MSTSRSHELKIWPEFFSAVLDGSKTFELRKDDRGFRAGDTMILKEWRPDTKSYTGRELNCTVSYVLSGPVLGLMRNWVVLALRHEGSKAASLASLRSRVTHLRLIAERALDIADSIGDAANIGLHDEEILALRAALPKGPAQSQNAYARASREMRRLSPGPIMEGELRDSSVAKTAPPPRCEHNDYIGMDAELGKCFHPAKYLVQTRTRDGSRGPVLRYCGTHARSWRRRDPSLVRPLNTLNNSK